MNTIELSKNEFNALFHEQMTSFLFVKNGEILKFKRGDELPVGADLYHVDYFDAGKESVVFVKIEVTDILRVADLIKNFSMKKFDQLKKEYEVVEIAVTLLGTKYETLFAWAEQTKEAQDEKAIDFFKFEGYEFKCVSETDRDETWVISRNLKTVAKIVTGFKNDAVILSASKKLGKTIIKGFAYGLNRYNTIESIQQSKNCGKATAIKERNFLIQSDINCITELGYEIR